MWKPGTRNPYAVGVNGVSRLFASDWVGIWYKTYLVVTLLDKTTGVLLPLIRSDPGTNNSMVPNDRNIYLVGVSSGQETRD